MGDASVESGLVSDELVSEQPALFVTYGYPHIHGETDRRESQVTHQSLYTAWQEVRRAATLAIPAIRSYGSAGAQPRVGEMFAVRGFAALRLAEDFCPGFPLHDLADFKPIYGPPLETDQALERALADLDSALVNAADSTRIIDFAQVARGRVLLALGRFADAAEAVAAVPTSYIENAHFAEELPGITTEVGYHQVNPWGDFADDTAATSTPSAVANREGGNGLDFVDAADPRLELKFLRMSDRDGFVLNAPAKYPDPSAPIVLTSGIEARLIEAEAALHSDDPSWLTMLNDLRAMQVTPALEPLVDPGSDPARVDLLFRERAFWLFGTGHRLADLRRLVSRYGRSIETVFPTGEYRLGGSYTNVTNLAFDPEPEKPYSPEVTGCTSR